MRFIFLVVAIFVHQVLCQLPIIKQDLLGSFRQPKLVSTIATISPTTIIYNNKQTNDEVEITTANQYTVIMINKTKNPTVTETDYTSTPAIQKSTTKGFSKLAALNSMATTPVNTNLLPLPPGAGAVLVKPTKYHYYPHNQHIYLLPECAIQQVCNAVYVRLNWTQPLCACPSRYRDPCSASLNSDDLHTTKLITGNTPERALTLVKTCEPTADMRLCRTPRDWSLLALQNIRTGKSHYLVICHCPESSILEGPMSHDQPTYASVPGIRVYGMMCVNGRRRSRPLRTEKSLVDGDMPVFPWHQVAKLVQSIKWD